MFLVTEQSAEQLSKHSEPPAVLICPGFHHTAWIITHETLTIIRKWFYDGLTISNHATYVHAYVASQTLWDTWERARKLQSARELKMPSIQPLKKIKSICRSGSHLEKSKQKSGRQRLSDHLNRENYTFSFNDVAFWVLRATKSLELLTSLGLRVPCGT